MSAFDIEEGNMQMSYMHPIVPQPKSSIYYKKGTFEVLEKDILPMDQIEFHKQAGEMIYSTLTGKAMDAYMLQQSLNNIITQMKLEKASSQAKDNRIKSLEDPFIEMGNDCTDIKAVEQLIKKKNEDIAAFKKQLKLPASLHPLTTEVLESQTVHEEMLELVLQLNTQLKEKEKEMDKLTKQASL